MSEKYKVRDNSAIHFITITIIDWVDVFIRPVYKHIIVDSLKYCQENKGLVVYAYVIMSSHIHLIVKSIDKFTLSEIIRDFKKFTSRDIVNAIRENMESRKVWLLNKFAYAANRVMKGKEYKLWKDGFHPIELNSNKLLDEKLDYIHYNPVKEEIVDKPEDYIYSSARDYAGYKGILDISLIE